MLEAIDAAGDVERRMNRKPLAFESPEEGVLLASSPPSSSGAPPVAARFLAAVAAAVRARLTAFEFLRSLGTAGPAAG